MAGHKDPGLSAPQDDYVFLVSADLIEHEKFLHEFKPTGDTDKDLRSFFEGVGQSGLSDKTLELGGSLVGLALGIISNHRNEMDRIDRGERTRWSDYQRWEPEQRQLYRHLMEMEEVILTSLVTKADFSDSYEAPR